MAEKKIHRLEFVDASRSWMEAAQNAEDMMNKMTADNYAVARETLPGGFLISGYLQEHTTDIVIPIVKTIIERALGAQHRPHPFVIDVARSIKSPITDEASGMKEIPAIVRSLTQGMPAETIRELREEIETECKNHDGHDNCPTSRICRTIADSLKESLNLSLQ